MRYSREQVIEYYAKRKYGSAYKQYIKKYSLSQEDYEEIYCRQRGSCAICKKPSGELKKRLAVDHCHKTKVVRGLLCDRCNLGLGHFNDDVEKFKAVIAYLERSKI